MQRKLLARGGGNSVDSFAVKCMLFLDWMNGSPRGIGGIVLVHRKSGLFSSRKLTDVSASSRHVFENLHGRPVVGGGQVPPPVRFLPWSTVRRRRHVTATHHGQSADDGRLRLTAACRQRRQSRMLGTNGQRRQKPCPRVAWVRLRLRTRIPIHAPRVRQACCLGRDLVRCLGFCPSALDCCERKIPTPTANSATESNASQPCIALHVRCSCPKEALVAVSYVGGRPRYGGKSPYPFRPQRAIVASF